MNSETRMPQSCQPVLALLNRLDPYGLEPGSPGGPPRDEYGFDAEPIARLLQEGPVGVSEVDGIWSHWFGEALTDVIGLKPAEQFVAELNALGACEPASGSS